MGSEENQLHGFFFPLMAYGHMNPMVDIARLVAARGVKATIIVTLHSASALSTITERDRNSGLDISIQAIRFPAVEAGLPEGIDTVDSITSPDMGGKFMLAVSLLEEPFKHLIEQNRPDFIASDMFLPWTTDIAANLGIPRLVFHGMGFFSLCIQESMRVHEPHNKIPKGTESFEVPDLPDQIEIKMSQVPDHLLDASNPFRELLDRVRDAELRSYGVIVNSFYELEPAYAEHYRNVMGRKAWHIGPVSLRNRDMADKVQRGKIAAVDEHYVLNWLDSKIPNSVLYVCFGSISRITSAPLMEIAIGLENSGVSFVWVIRKSGTKDDGDDDNFLPEGFEERINGKGLIIRDWAPQVLILDHQAIGGFMTHCGWNSVLEGISAGVPMITWPMFAEQFYNESCVTQVLKTGIKVGAEKWSSWIETNEVSVKKENVQKAVTQLMGDGDEAMEIRRKAKEYKDMAIRAVEEGGSSYRDLSAMIDELRMTKQTSPQTEPQTKLDVSV